MPDATLLPSLEEIQSVHLIGIGGIGMSAIARMLIERGIHVTGSDREPSSLIDALATSGARVVIGHSATQVGHPDLVVYSQAIDAANPELTRAQELGIPTLTYPQMLGTVSQGKCTIAIAGCHGKTTTTAMVGKLLRDTQQDPTIIVGSLIPEFGGNYVSGKGRYFVVEACEYRRAFLNLTPHILVITNVDSDHLDYYRDIADIRSAFRQLAEKVPREGAIIADLSEPNTGEALRGLRRTIVDYRNVTHPLDFRLRIPGAHNVANAQAAAAVGIALGLPRAQCLSSLARFTGSSRRFESHGTWRGVELIDDYAHHPREIAATLAAARERYPKNRVIVVFQPHLYSRTKTLFHDFLPSFKDASHVILADIYAAREKDPGDISSKILSEALGRVHPSVLYGGNRDAIAEMLPHVLQPGDVLLTMGAGDVYKVLAALMTNDK